MEAETTARLGAFHARPALNALAGIKMLNKMLDIHSVDIQPMVATQGLEEPAQLARPPAQLSRRALIGVSGQTQTPGNNP